MSNKWLRGRIHREERGITGLETAIILIAFVVVASVFAYTVLSAGLFATERGKEAVHAGLEGARATMHLRGGVIAMGNTTGNFTDHHVRQLMFTVASALGGEPINFMRPIAGNNTGLAHPDSRNVVVISYIDSDQHVTDLFWNWVAIGHDDGDNLLEGGEKFQITIGGTAGTGNPGSLRQALTHALGVNDAFTIEIKPPVGAVLTIERTIPGVIDTVMSLN